MAEASTLRVAAFLPHASANGPGVRSVLWVQGCGRECPECCNAPFADPAGGIEATVGQVVASILGVEGAEGVTFSGGEPFEQAVQLAAVARQVRALRDIGVVCYSGFTLDQLRSNGVAGADELLEQVDLLIDGPFDSARAAPLRWRGSDNQRLHFLTARYRELEEMAATAQTEAEVEIHGVSVVRTGAITGSALGDITRLLTEQYGVKL